MNVEVLLVVFVIGCSAPASRLPERDAGASAVPVNAPEPALAAPSGPRSLEDQVREEVLRRYVPARADSRVTVDFARTSPWSATRELYVESASGHAGGITLTGGSFAENGFRLLRLRAPRPGEARTTIEVARVPADLAATELDCARLALEANVRETIPEGEGGLGLQGFSGTDDIHLRVALVDDAGRRLERVYSDYPSSQEQAKVLPLKVASWCLSRLSSKAPWSREASSAEARAFITAHRPEAASHGLLWWVPERYAALRAAL